ncbi:propanediol utilization microcompartment protein PduK [Desulfotomaculum defluvii]
MIKNALGLIEVVGLAAGLIVADAAVKAANVELIGYELTKGGGMTVIKLQGDVGAVKAAVDAGAAAVYPDKVYATRVIPRPTNDLDKIVNTKETVGKKDTPPEPTNLSGPELNETIEEIEPTESLVNEEQVIVGNAKDICNLCGDPACGRKKGEPRTTCIHYQKHDKEDD